MLKTPANLNDSFDDSNDKDPAWDDESLASPHDDKAKAERVNRMFTAIAESYDLNNRVHSLWRDQAWRRKAVHLARVQAETDVVVDVACGTGDLSFAFARANPARVIGIDFVAKMIAVAQSKQARLVQGGVGGGGVEFRVGDALALDLANASADVVSIAFGIRNVTDPLVALREFRRVLRPGGRVVILEFGLPRNRLLRWLYQFYFNHLMPWTATLVAGDRSGAYKYLPRSVNTFIERDEMVRLLGEAGFGAVQVHPLTFGICIGYLGFVPSAAEGDR